MNQKDYSIYVFEKWDDSVLMGRTPILSILYDFHKFEIEKYTPACFVNERVLRAELYGPDISVKMYREQGGTPVVETCLPGQAFQAEGVTVYKTTSIDDDPYEIRIQNRIKKEKTFINSVSVKLLRLVVEIGKRYKKEEPILEYKEFQFTEEINHGKKV